MNTKDTDYYEYRKLVAQTKFSLIAPVVSRTYPDANMSAYFRRVAQFQIDWPDGSKRKFSYKTLKWWYHVYLKQGLDGLFLKID